MEQETAALRKLLELLDQIDAVMMDEGGWSEKSEAKIIALRNQWTRDLAHAEREMIDQWTSIGISPKLA